MEVSPYVAATVSILVSAILTFGVRAAARRYGFVAKPKSDRWHKRPTAMLGGVDALVFTAGVGERSQEIRKRVCENLDYLGLELDRTANETCKPDADIATPTSTARILVIATREDLTIMRETRRLVASSMTPHSRAKSAAPL